MAKILAVDDKMDNLVTLSALLKNMMPDCVLVAAQSGREGIEMARSEMPDAILLDVQMPDMDGFETCRRLKSDDSTRHIPVIMITAIRTDSKSRIKGLEIGADAFLAKPIDPYELVSQVNVTLRIKRAEDALRAQKASLERLVEERTAAMGESEKRFRAIFEESPIGIALIDSLTGHIYEVNPRFAEICGRKKADLATIDWMSITHPDDVGEDLENMALMNAGKIPGFNMNKRYRRPDGAYFWINMTIAPMTIKDKDRPRHLCMIEDITERKRAETDIRRQIAVTEAINRILQKALQADTDTEVARIGLSEAEALTASRFGWIGEVNSSGRMDTIALSDLGWETCGIAAAQMATIKDMEVKGLFGKVLADGKSLIANAPGTHPDRAGIPSGHPELTAFLGVPLRQGELAIGMVALGNKPSGYSPHDQKAIETLSVALVAALQRKRTEEALRISEERIRTVFEAAKDVAFIITDAKAPEPKVIEFSPGAEKIFGYSKTEMTGAPLSVLHRTGDLAALYEARKQMREDKMGFSGETTLVRKSGEKFPVFLSTYPLLNKIGGIDATLWVCIDISERKKLESQLLQAQKMQSIGTLAGGIAHDFNNILTSVIGYTELSMEEVENDSRVKDHLQEVYSAGKRAKDLVSRILTFARQSDEELKPIQVATITNEVLKFIRSTIPTSIEIRQSIESDALIMGNATQVHQILMNLFTNAAYAMEDEGGILEVSLKNVTVDNRFERRQFHVPPGDYVTLTVSDTGVGIGPEIVDSIFEPYFTTKGPGKGTGMGLAMVYGIVDRYGGKITVESKLGQGTRFTIFLPVTRKRQEHSPYQTEALPTGTERILFVDDEAPIVKMGSQVLERLGYTVTTRTASTAALELFRSGPNDFDLVISDMSMPKMNGDRLAIELKKIRPEIKVILCTGYSKKISDETEPMDGIAAFAYKPISKAELAKTVRKVLDGDYDNKKTRRILVIDDELAIRNLFNKHFSGKGYEIIEASNGREGLTRYREHQPDLVVTDIVMPDKEGIEMIIELRREFPDAKIIAISGGGLNAPGSYLEIAKNLGALRTFPKPIDWTNLSMAIEELLL